MSPRTDIQFEEIREEKRELILQTGLTLFATDGYHNVSVSDIARAANISKGLMYNYFRSKEDLLSTIVQKGFKDIADAFDVDNDGILTQHELGFFIDYTFKTLKANKQFWRLYFMLILQPDVFEIVKKEYNIIKEKIGMIAHAFFRQQGVEDPKREMMVLAALIEGMAFQFVFTENGGNYPLHIMEDYIYQKYGLNKK
jgi:AcrR family transcriptional regulator